MPFRLALLALACVVAFACQRDDSALVLVDVQPGSLSRCAEVVVEVDGGTRRSSPLAARPGEQLAVAVFAEVPGERGRARANGYTSAACLGTPDEVSAPADVQLSQGQEVTLELDGEGSCTDGSDGDGDGLADCLDSACAADPVCGATSVFPYAPSNVVLTQVPLPDAGLVISCDAGFSTSALNGWLCGAPLPPAAVIDGGPGRSYVVLSTSSLTITEAGRWTITGDRPLILAVFGDARIDGPLLAGADRARPGPGGSWPGCPGSGSVGVGGAYGGGGGGGGGYGGSGARGGQSGPASNPPARADGGPGGPAFGTPELVPLLGGCSGGGGGPDPNGSPSLRDGGGGGGAIQLSVAGELHVTSWIGAPGGGGLGGYTNRNCGGGAGGSGGAVLLEARHFTLAASARITANGGAGSEGDDDAPASFAWGENGRVDGPLPARGGTSNNNAATGGDGGAGTVPTTPGESFRFTSGGGGGGGGGVGRIRLNAVEGCNFQGPSLELFSPKPTSNLNRDAGCP